MQEIYRKYCREQALYLPVFAQDWWLDAVCTDGIWDAAVVMDEGGVRAVLPWFLKQKAGFRYITMPHFTKHLGPFFADNYSLTEQHQLMEALIAQLPRVHAFHQNFHPDLTNWLPFYWAGYRQTTRYTYCLDLRDPAQVEHNINRNMRRNIKKAQAQLTVSHDGTPEAFYAINRLSFERQGLSAPYTFEQFARHDAALAARAARQFFFAKDAAGRTHAAAYLIRDARRSYYHLSGDDPALRDSGAGILLVWEAIRYTQEVWQLPIFDFSGSMLPNVEAIRRQFGAVQTPYSYVWKHHSPLLAWIDAWRGR